MKATITNFTGMKVVRILLLVIGLLGLAAAVFGLIKGQSFLEQLLPIVCGASLIYGYFYFGREEFNGK